MRKKKKKKKLLALSLIQDTPTIKTEFIFVVHTTYKISRWNVFKKQYKENAYFLLHYGKSYHFGRLYYKSTFGGISDTATLNHIRKRNWKIRETQQIFSYVFTKLINLPNLPSTRRNTINRLAISYEP